MTDSSEASVRQPAEENPWYLLATLHGSSLPAPRHESRNRYAWNRYYASQLTPDERERLKDRIPPEELTPLNDEELLEWKRLFDARANNANIDIPNTNDTIELDNVNFSKSCLFSGFIFIDCVFSKSYFCSIAEFNRSSFIRYANFSEVNFFIGANFSESTFKEVDFVGMKLSRGGAFFSNTEYAEKANFSYVELPQTVHFHKAVFNKSADFKGAQIGGFFDFRDVKISGPTEFQHAQFGAEVLFTDAKFQAPTDFDGCRFEKSPPQLAGATLHQRTNWRRVSWPRLKGLQLHEVEALIDAYGILKLQMEAQKRHLDELMFFAEELKGRRQELLLTDSEWNKNAPKVTRGGLKFIHKTLNWFKGLPILLYGVTCDYGQSFMLPLCWLFILIVGGFDVIGLWLQPDLSWEQALRLSFANCLGSFGFRKDMLSGVPESLSVCTHLFSLFQGIIALILLFLTGLGLRNRFRMK